MGQMRPRTDLKSMYSFVDVYIRRLLMAVFVTCLLAHHDAVTSQSLLEQNGIEITHQIGKDAVLTCTVKDIGKRRIIWSKLSDPYPISVGSTRFTPSKKYKIDVKDNSYILTIKNVDLGDAGEYQCRASGQVYLADTITLNIQAGGGKTHLIPTQTRIVAEVGSSAVLPCHVENLHDKLVLWKNSQNEVLALRKKTYSGDGRMSVIHNTRPEWSLEIKNLRESDFDFYTCIINSDPVLTRTVRLINSAPARTAPVLMMDTNFRKRVVVMAGETVTLTCNFRSNPPTKTSWYKREIVDGKKKKENLGEGASLTLESVQVEQSGDYVCMGKNGMKPSGRAKTRVIVNAPPTTATTTTESTTFVPDGPTAPRLYHHEGRNKISQTRGLNVEIKCTAIGQPRPNIHWTRHGHRIQDDHKYKVVSETLGRHTIHSTLLVRSLSSRDYGKYMCVGYNQLGMQNLDFDVVEL